MADDTRVAKRYAAALFDIALRDDKIDQVLDDVTLIERFLREVQYLRAVIYQPLVSDEHKRDVIRKAFETRVSATTLNFLLLLVRKRRETLAEVMLADFRRRVDDHLGKIVAEVQSAVPLSATQINALTKSLVQRTGKVVDVKTSVNPELIGGLLIRIGDNVIDGTVRTGLADLRHRLIAAQ